jgi:hypothetical protein
VNIKQKIAEQVMEFGGGTTPHRWTTQLHPYDDHSGEPVAERDNGIVHLPNNSAMKARHIQQHTDKFQDETRSMLPDHELGAQSMKKDGSGSTIKTMKIVAFI